MLPARRQTGSPWNPRRSTATQWLRWQPRRRTGFALGRSLPETQSEAHRTLARAELGMKLPIAHCSCELRSATFSGREPFAPTRIRSRRSSARSSRIDSHTLQTRRIQWRPVDSRICSLRTSCIEQLHRIVTTTPTSVPTQSTSQAKRTRLGSIEYADRAASHHERGRSALTLLVPSDSHNPPAGAAETSIHGVAPGCPPSAHPLSREPLRVRRCFDCLIAGACRR